MPELPEVESIRRSLDLKTVGKTITGVRVIWPSAIISMPGQDFCQMVSGREILSTGRRGKYLLINLSGGLTLIVHFRMTGRLVYYPEKTDPDKHTHVLFTLDQGELHYSDIRKFGRIQLVPSAKVKEEKALAKLGPEPLGESFDFDQFGLCLSKKKSTVKSALLDQCVIAGLGNIYADEALFKAGILPDRRTDSLKISEIIKLQGAVREVLTAGIKARGTSFKDYRDADGRKGMFQDSLMVYGRGGKPCKICGEPLRRKKIAGRTTVFCPNCQE